jgi:tetratricopeptide (TPR) repeat protein
MMPDRETANARDIRQAELALDQGRLDAAEAVLSGLLQREPQSAPALRMVAEISSRLGNYEHAEQILSRCLKISPDFAHARYNYAMVLRLNGRFDAALSEARRLLKDNPSDHTYRAFEAALLSRIGRPAEAARIYAALAEDFPDRASLWLSLGHVLKAAGQRDESIAAYRACVNQAPASGEAYWSLANLKVFRFTEPEIAAMQKLVRRPDLRDDDRAHLHFALGKALEDEGLFAASFSHFKEGNALRRRAVGFDPSLLRDRVARSKVLFSRVFFEDRQGWGDPSSGAIFIIGLPRSGSTLVEQILASHSAVEGLAELPEVGAIVRSLSRRREARDRSPYPDVLATLEAPELRRLGEDYLQRVEVYRQLKRPVFVDKMPNNFVHVGLIHLILPNAKIVDVRRHPLACGLSCFKQNFGRGQNFSDDLGDIGEYYCQYVDLMDHFDNVLPSRIHRVIYENLIENPELEIRRLLTHCELPFETSCLKFHETKRPVQTASSEQVRTPIFRDAADHWRHFEPWLGPLKAALASPLASLGD